MRESSPIQFTLRNLGWIATSLFLAFVVWIAANMSNNPIEQREISRVPVKILLPDGYVITQQPTSTMARAVIRTQKSEWSLIVAEDVLITANLSNIREPGEYRVELEAEMAAPRHGQVVAIRPSTLTFTIDHEVEKRVPISVVVSQEPPLGYTYPRDLVCDQTEATVRGSAERVDSVDRVEVRLVLSDDLNPVVKEDQPLIPVQSNGRNVTGTLEIEPATVNCPVDIQVRQDVIQLRVLPAVVGNPPPGYLFEGFSLVDPESVGVTGNATAIDQMNNVVRTEQINLATRTETFTVEIPVDLPDGVSLVPENQLISVTVNITAATGSRQIEEVPVEVTGLDTTLYRVTGLANTVTVIAVGPQDELPTRDQVRVKVDLSGLPPGNHQVEPSGELIDQTTPSTMSISVVPAELGVTIESVDITPTPSPTPTMDPAQTPTPAETES